MVLYYIGFLGTRLNNESQGPFFSMRIALQSISIVYLPMVHIWYKHCSVPEANFMPLCIYSSRKHPLLSGL